MIFTDAKGRPFARPEPPPAGCDVETRIAYIRAVHAYNDAIKAAGNAAFVSAFNAAVRR